MNERNESEHDEAAQDEPRLADSYDFFRGLQEAPRIINALTFEKLIVVMAYVTLLVIGAVLSEERSGMDCHRRCIDYGSVDCGSVCTGQGSRCQDWQKTSARAD